MLILAGNDIWPTDAYAPFVDKTRQFLDAGVPVAAICGATGALAAVGLLDERPHTSNALEFLQGIGYGGAICIGTNLRSRTAISSPRAASPPSTSPARSSPASTSNEPRVLDAWYALYGERDPRGYYELMSSGS